MLRPLFQCHGNPSVQCISSSCLGSSAETRPALVECVSARVCVCACVCVRVCVVIADLHISFASHNKFIFNSANCQSSIKVCVTAFWLFALIRNRTLSTMVCVYMCACIVMIPPMGGMVLILVFTLYKYFQCFFWQRSFFNYLRTEKIGFTISLTCHPCTDIH